MRGVAVNTAPLSLRSDAGRPCSSTALWKTSTTSWALTVGKASEARNRREWSSIMFMISACSPPARCQCVMSVCHVSLGRSASKRIRLLCGRFCGWATIKPSRLRIRQIVETDGAGVPVELLGEVVGDRRRAAVVAFLVRAAPVA